MLQFTEVEVGSPVDMARSYMQGRPPWASPSENHVECKYPSPIGIQLYKEETPYSVGGKSTSSLKVPLQNYFLYIIVFDADCSIPFVLMSSIKSLVFKLIVIETCPQCEN